MKVPSIRQRFWYMNYSRSLTKTTPKKYAIYMNDETRPYNHINIFFANNCQPWVPQKHCSPIVLAVGLVHVFDGSFV